jgi:putative ABC transport system ATP-binding protein
VTDAARCVDVWKRYATRSGTVTALAQVNARFPTGGITAIVGPSGSGKSTLLHLLAALDRPTHGDVVVHDRSIGWLPHRGRRTVRRDEVTFVFQRPSDNFVPRFTINEHVRRSAAAEARELFRAFGIQGRADRIPSALSGGEQARAAFALALLRRTPLVLADEPTAELDQASAVALLELVRARTDGGVSFVFATHDPNVIRIADEVIPLDRATGFDAPPRLQESALPKVAARGSSRPASPVVWAHGLRKTYGRGQAAVHAVVDADVVARPGELVALTGPSGSGKSALLGLLAGWQRPDAGSVSVAGRSDPAELDWATLAVLPQKFGLLQELTVRENVEYPARIAGQLASHRPWIDALIADLDLAELQHRPPTEISVGQQQRAALARALALHPAVLLADEPLAHQDSRSADAALRVLRRAASQGTCCLVAVHEDIGKHTDRVIHMAGGRLEPDAA